MKLVWIVAMTLGAAACGKKDEAGGGAGKAEGAGAAPSAKLAQNAVADANAAVPKELAAKLKFVEGSYDEKDVKALAVLPEGWKKSEVIPGSYSAPDGLGFMTKFSVGSNCDGSCAPKDWAATADKVEFAQFSSGGFAIQKDEKSAGSRVMVATKNGSAYVAVALWKDGADRYFSCRANLDTDAAAAAPAFEKACRAMTPVW